MKKKYYEKLNECFSELIDKGMKLKYDHLTFKTSWNLFSGCMQTTWDRGLSDMNNHQIKLYCDGYSKGYTDAVDKLAELEEKK